MLAWGVSADTTGFNINTIGYILLVVGIVGILLSLLFWSSWAGPGYFGDRGARRRTVVEEDL